MKRHTAKECTVEEFDDWAAAGDRFDAVGQAADEEGGDFTRPREIFVSRPPEVLRRG